MTAPQRVMRSYTRGLKIPRLIGRLTDDFRLPGGPYTLTQFMVAVATIIVGYLTVGLWAQWLPEFSVIGSQWVALVALVPMAVGAAKIAGFLPEDTNPIRAVGDLSSGTRPAQFGTRAGVAVEKLPRPVRVRGRVLTQGLHPQVVQPSAAADVRRARGSVVPPGNAPGRSDLTQARVQASGADLMGALTTAIKEKR